MDHLLPPESFRDVPVDSLFVVNTLKKIQIVQSFIAEPHSTVGSVADVRTGGRWFDPLLSQYSFRGLMIVIATGFTPLSPLSVVSTMVCWKTASGLERILCGVLVKRPPEMQVH